MSLRILSSRLAQRSPLARAFATDTNKAGQEKSTYDTIKDKVGEGLEKVGKAFDKEGVIGKQFQADGKVGGKAQRANEEVGNRQTAFDKEGAVGHQFTDEGAVGGRAQKASDKVEHTGEKLQKEANKP